MHPRPRLEQKIFILHIMNVHKKTFPWGKDILMYLQFI